jgi:hypothetical protein
MPQQPPSVETVFRLYPSRRSGPILLVCRKCEKKLKKSGHKPALKIGKSLKRLDRKEANPKPIQVISTGCMDLCPKDAVSLCLPALHPLGLIIVRTKQEIAALHRQLNSSGVVSSLKTHS